MSSAEVNPQTASWLKSLRCKPSTIGAHKRHLNRLFDFIAENGGPCAGEVRFQQIVPLKMKGLHVGYGPANHRFVEGFLTYLAHKEKDREKAAKARNRHLSTLRQFFCFLVDERVLVEDPTYHVKSARTERLINENKYLRPNQSAALLMAAASSGEHAPRNTAIVGTLLRSGLRPLELCNLTSQGVEFHTERVRSHGKTGEVSAPMPPSLAELLTKYISSRYYQTRCHGAKVLFPDDDGRTPLTDSTLLELLRPLCQAAGLSDEVTTYWLRHTFATDLNRLRVPFPMISQSLNHKNPNNTLHYAHEREPRLRNIIEEGPTGRPLLNAYRKMFRAAPSSTHPPSLGGKA